jgi:Flp pilus assembly protein TadG
MRRLRDEESGAVLVIVAISLLALLGMVVLTFDLGRGVALKRNMVNAADAAALAAARECGLAHGTAPAETEAKDLIVDNNGSATLTNIAFDSVPQCSGAAADGERQVRVTVSVPQEYFFAQIFGFNNGTVTASATAEWTLGQTSPAPLRVDQLALKACEEEGIVDPETGRIDCYITYEKGSDPLNSDDRGWLNLPEGWPVQDKQPSDSNPLTCDSQAGGAKDLGDYIGTMGGMGTPGKPFAADLWDPAPTWVCGASGKKTSNVDDIQAWVNNVADMLADPNLPDFKEPPVQFPVVAPDCPGAGCYEWKFTPGIAYPVVDLQDFYVKGAWNRPKIPKSEEDNCKFKFPSNDSFCVHLQTPGPNDPPSSGGSVQVWLVD